MNIEGQLTNIQEKYEIIHEQEIRVTKTGPRKAYILKELDTDTYHLAYEEKTRQLRLMPLDEYLNVTEAERYDDTTKTNCCYCSAYKEYQLKDEQPALDACFSCHRSIKKYFDRFLEEVNEVELTARAI